MAHATHAKDRLKKKNTCKRNEKSQDLKTQNYWRLKKHTRKKKGVPTWGVSSEQPAGLARGGVTWLPCTALGAAPRGSGRAWCLSPPTPPWRQAGTRLRPCPCHAGGREWSLNRNKQNQNKRLNNYVQKSYLETFKGSSSRPGFGNRTPHCLGDDENQNKEPANNTDPPDLVTTYLLRQSWRYPGSPACPALGAASPRGSWSWPACWARGQCRTGARRSESAHTRHPRPLHSPRDLNNLNWTLSFLWTKWQSHLWLPVGWCNLSRSQVWLRGRHLWASHTEPRRGQRLSWGQPPWAASPGPRGGEAPAWTGDWTRSRYSAPEELKWCPESFCVNIYDCENILIDVKWASILRKSLIAFNHRSGYN